MDHEETKAPTPRIASRGVVVSKWTPTFSTDNPAFNQRTDNIPLLPGAPPLQYVKSAGHSTQAPKSIAPKQFTPTRLNRYTGVRISSDNTQQRDSLRRFARQQEMRIVANKKPGTDRTF